MERDTPLYDSGFYDTFYKVAFYRTLNNGRRPFTRAAQEPSARISSFLLPTCVVVVVVVAEQRSGEIIVGRSLVARDIVVLICKLVWNRPLRFHAVLINGHERLFFPPPSLLPRARVRVLCKFAQLDRAPRGAYEAAFTSRPGLRFYFPESGREKGEKRTARRGTREPSSRLTRDAESHPAEARSREAREGASCAYLFIHSFVPCVLTTVCAGFSCSTGDYGAASKL